jgi:hypothetical protein
MNTLYKKDGKIKQRKHIVLYYEDRQVFNPSEEELLENGWEKYETPQPTEEELFEREKQNKLNEIQHYDSSREVNNFYIDEYSVWLDKETRTGLTLRFNSELAAKHETTSLWYNNIKFTLPINDAIAMLYAIELYASACYDNTQQHIANVNEITTMEELENYDYRSGYPEMLRFEI